MNVSDIPILGSLFGSSATNVDPKQAKAALDNALEQARIDQANATTAKDKADSDARIQQLQDAAKALDIRQQQEGVNQQNADANATRATTGQQNADTRATQAADTANWHQQGLNLKQQADQSMANYRQGMLDAKDDQNKINIVKAEYQHNMAMINAQINQLKDQMQAYTTLDTNEVSNAVNQADNRNSVATNFLGNANTQATDLAKMGAFAGNPGLANGYMSGLMNVAPAFSNSMGGAPVPVGQLTAANKAEITRLVMTQGIPFNQAVQQVANQAANPGFAAGGTPPPPAAPPPAAAVPQGYSVGNLTAAGSMNGMGSFAPGGGGFSVGNPVVAGSMNDMGSFAPGGM